MMTFRAKVAFHLALLLDASWGNVAVLAATVALYRLSHVVKQKLVEVAMLSPSLGDYFALLGLFLTLGILVLAVLFEVEADSLFEDEIGDASWSFLLVECEDKHGGWDVLLVFWDWHRSLQAALPSYTVFCIFRWGNFLIIFCGMHLSLTW